MRRRPSGWLILVALAIAATVLHGQAPAPIADPASIAFPAPTVTTAVTGYRVVYFLATDTLTGPTLPAPQATQELGTPTPDATGTITTGLLSVCDGLKPDTAYQAVVAVETATGVSPYSPGSPPFEWTSAHVASYTDPTGAVTPFCTSGAGPTIAVPAAPTNLHFDSVPTPPVAPPPSGCSPMASFDNCTDGGYLSSTSSTTYSFSHVTGAGANRLLFVFVVTYGVNPNPVSGVTYGGVAMTLAKAQFQNGDSLQWGNLYVLPAPASGSNTVTVTLTSTGLQIDGVALSYADCDQANYLDAVNASSHPSSFPTDYTWSPSISVANVHDWVITCDMGYYGTSTLNSGGTQRKANASIKLQIDDSNGEIGATGTYSNPSLTTTGGGGPSTDFQVAFRAAAAAAGGSLPLFAKRFPTLTKRRTF